LVDAIKAEKPKSFDTNTIRVFLGAVRAYCTMNDLEKAGNVSTVLVELGPDNLQINDVLVEFCRLLNVERKKADARVTEVGESANIEEANAAKAHQAAIHELLAKTIIKLSERNDLSLGHMMFIGETLNAIDKTEQASDEFRKILKRTETDPEFAKRSQKAMTLIRTELLKSLRKEGKFTEALQQVEKLISEHRNALEPLMEKGRILEAIAEKNPAKFQAAIDHWTMLRNRLQGMKKKPNEYYEVMYNCASCLVREAELSKDKTKKMDSAKKAEQVLKSPLILSPKLNGPDTVAKYKALMNKAIQMQGRTPEKADAKAEKKP
jgi:tetratricopeptide (TPR) repeat protein